MHNTPRLARGRLMTRSLGGTAHRENVRSPVIGGSANPNPRPKSEGILGPCRWSTGPMPTDDHEEQPNANGEPDPGIASTSRAEHIRPVRLMATGMTGASWSPFGGGGQRRCSFCGRRESAVQHLVQARDALICDSCVAEAQEAIAAATADHKRVRIRPRPDRPANQDAAELAIEQAFETVFSRGGDEATLSDAIEDGANLRPTFAQAQERNPIRGSTDVSVEYVRFLGPDEAEVHFVILFSGSSPLPRFPDTGHAVLDGGTWKVSRDTWCRAIGRIGVQCPPLPA